MTFFNKKEDVLKIELTPYGRSLLSNGKLMPKYYAFFDDDVLYDIQFGGGTEEQSNIKDRILDNTPRLRPQRDLVSPESQLSSFEREEDSSRPYLKIAMNYLTEPLGTSDGTYTEAPSWNVSFILGEISHVSSSIETDTSHRKRIPQLETTLEYTMEIRNERNDPPVRGQEVSPNVPVSSVFSDGTYINLLDEQIICRILEEKGFLQKDGLEMEVFLYEENEETPKKLKFAPREKTIIDGMLVEDDIVSINISPEYVEYWLNIETDSGIPDAEICKGVQHLKSQDIHVDVEVVCPDLEGIDFDIYRTRITDVEDC
tara:strand:- start:260 stop:1204 length:945 start_codon:yes stop_codon:yes gene_type:complete